MNNEFVPYEEALALKELGFDEPCVKTYTKEGVFTQALWNFTIKNSNENLLDESITAPLYQQAFRWLRENYKLYYIIYQDFGWNISGGIWDIGEHVGVRYDWDSSNTFSSYEEAELECLKKLIEIVKNK